MNRHPLQRFWYGSLRLLAQVLFICLFGVRVFGRRNVPSDGGAVLASNHQSFLDPVLIGLGLWRQVSFMARHELFEIPGFSALIRSLNAMPVRKGAADRRAIREAISRAGSGELLVVFPEGTRNDSGGLAELAYGAAFIARKARCPIVPVAIYGAHLAWPMRYRIFHLSAIKVAFGTPVDTAEGDNEYLMKKTAEGIRHLLEKMV